LLAQTQASSDTKVAAAWNQLFKPSPSPSNANTILYNGPKSGEAYVEDIADNAVRSEGQSYGMMIALQLNHQTEFDEMWTFVKDYMWKSGNTISWQTNTSGGVTGSGGAPDGDEWFAAALLFAHYRWGDTSGKYNYGTEAQKTLDLVRTTDFNQSLHLACTAGSCVPVTNADDPVSGRCAGTCDSTGACKSKRGQPCNTVAGLCLGGLFCSPDNYCCDRGCTGPCEACDVVSSVGTCTTVTDGPHVGHTGCQGSNTTCSGSCGGSVNGQCVWPTGSCGQSSCANQSGNAGTSYVAAGACSVGACNSGNSSSCGGGLLCASTTACKTSCAADTDCITGDYCAGGTCATKGGNGATCSSNTQCGSGACVDSVCCESACPGLCMACSSAKTGNTDGLCRGVKVGTDPDSECAVDAANACGQDGTCDGSGGCRLQQNGISCGSSSCTSANFTAAGRCNGTGTCIPASGSTVCTGSFACGSSTTCGTTCSEASTGGCISGYECLNGACVPATVPCGGPACAVANGGGECCITDPNNTGTNAVLSCLPPGGTCGGSFINCNGKSDCPTGQYCCAAGNGCTPGHYNTYCTANVSSCVGGTMSFGYQVCDPAVNTGKECVTGTCKSDTACLPGLSICS
jgi:hypothetical protein